VNEDEPSESYPRLVKLETSVNDIIFFHRRSKDLKNQSFVTFDSKNWEYEKKAGN
jgi:hypothetical protein